MRRFKYISGLVLIALLVVYSCKKDETVLIDNETTSSKDNGIAENLYADIKRVVEEAADDEGQSSKMASYSFGACATVTTVPNWADTTFPKVMTIDFGSANCVGANGINRRGQIIVTLTDRYRTVGSVLTIQPQNYFVEDVQVEGTKTLTNTGYNTSNNLEYQVDVVNGRLTYTDGTITTWASTRTNEWIEGDSTTFFTHGLAGICDDVYLITGSASGVNRNGLNYSVNIVSGSPLRKEICCRWLVSGILEITPAGMAVRMVNYGGGVCDRQATITINGNTFNVNMF